MMGSGLDPEEVWERYCERHSPGYHGRAIETFQQEHPRHPVRIANAFYLGKYEVTNSQYRSIKPRHSTGQRRGHSIDGHNQPVALVSWDDTFEFCGELTTQSKAPFRLPTEAEWEYACRAGTQSVWYWGDEMDTTYSNLCDTRYGEGVRAVSWIDPAHDDGHAVAAPVGRFEPNAFGLYDMSGNVWEFCSSEFRPYPYRADNGREDLTRVARRVVRGGAWGSGWLMHRSANRFRQTQSYVGRDRGFRVAVSISAEGQEGPGPPDSAARVELLYRLHTDADEVEPDLVRSTIRILRNRLTAAMAAHCHLEARGADQVLVQVRREVGVDIDRLRSLLEASGELEFRLCATDPTKCLKASKGVEVPGYHRHWLNLRKGESPRPGAPRPRWHLVEDRVRITGSSLADAYVTSQGRGGRPAVGFRMNEAGADAFAQLTKDNIGAPIAILIDGKLMAAPIVKARIAGVGIISGRFTREEAEDLARILRSGPLPVEMELVSLDGKSSGGSSVGTADEQGREP